MTESMFSDKPQAMAHRREQLVAAMPGWQQRAEEVAEPARVHHRRLLEAVEDTETTYRGGGVRDREVGLILSACRAHRLVVERHVPKPAGFDVVAAIQSGRLPDPEGPRCERCLDQLRRVPYPCPDVRDIAAIYGVRWDAEM
jgi:hypothetical protein